jgi:uracil DNA glycosylase
MECFTDAVIQKISEKEHVVFFAVGRFAYKDLKLTRNKHLVLESGHPSPLSIIKESGLVISILVKQMCTEQHNKGAIDWIEKSNKSNFPNRMLLCVTDGSGALLGKAFGLD